MAKKNIQSVEPNIADLANGWLKSYKLDYKLEQESLIFGKNTVMSIRHIGVKCNMLPSQSGLPDYDCMATFISAIQKEVIKDVVLFADRKIGVAKKIVNK